ncbi:MAG TPA: glycosyltransferase family 2 protein [Flavisolibacter sp.]
MRGCVREVMRSAMDFGSRNKFHIIFTSLNDESLETLSIIIPCYNEENLVVRVLDKVIHTPLDYNLTREVIVVDDASTDRTFERLQEYAAGRVMIRLHRHPVNMGKGAAIRSGIAMVTGSIVVIQDADLEYDPKDYNRLLEPIMDGYADVVYGSRFMGQGPHRVLFFFHTMGNKLLTFLSNLFTQLNLTDMETGYKMFRTDVLRRIRIRENRFGFEPEITAKMSRIPNIRIYETGIRYYGRTYKEGKKINWRDGLRAVYCIFRYNIFDRR